MLYREIIAVCSHIHTKHKYTVWAERRIFNVKPVGTYSNHWALIVHTACHCHLMRTQKCRDCSLHIACPSVELFTDFLTFHVLYLLTLIHIVSRLFVRSVGHWTLPLSCVNWSMCEANSHHLVPMIGMRRSVPPFIHLHVVGRTEVQKATFYVSI